MKLSMMKPSAMRLPDAAHTSQPWRIHDLAMDFELEDVWALPTPGTEGDLKRIVGWFADDGSPGAIVAVLLAIRFKLGKLLRWDTPETGVNARVPSLRRRLPADLRDGPTGPDFGPFTAVYLTDTEFVAEAANHTVHTLIHLGRVPDQADGGHRYQMAALVKPNGRFGNAYIAAIKPIRRTVVLPALIRTLTRDMT